MDIPPRFPGRRERHGNSGRIRRGPHTEPAHAALGFRAGHAACVQYGLLRVFLAAFQERPGGAAFSNPRCGEPEDATVPGGLGAAGDCREKKTDGASGYAGLEAAAEAFEAFSAGLEAGAGAAALADASVAAGESVAALASAFLSEGAAAEDPPSPVSETPLR